MADIERFEKYGLDGEPEHLRQARGAGATDSHYHAYVTVFCYFHLFVSCNTTFYLSEYW